MKWIKRNFYIPETRNDPKLRGRIGLQPYQEDVLREIFSTDEKGNFKYSIIVWSDIKKSAKSTICAAINLARAWHTEWGEFYIVANDLKQADSRVAHYLRRAIQLNENIKKVCRVVGYRTTLPNGAFIEAIPIDPSGEAGGNADQISWSELWGSNEKAKQQMWTEQTIPPNKHGRGFRLIESYAGFTDESKLLYSLYELGVRNGEMLWPDRLYPVTDGEPAPLEVYVNKSARMLCLWNTKPRCPWQTKEYYASEEKILLPNEFRRVHRNQWVSSMETFVPMEWYDSCDRTDDWPQINLKTQSMVIAVDAGISSDTFAVWMGCRHPIFKDHIMRIYSQKWEAKNGVIDFQGTKDAPGPEMEIRRLIKEYNVVWLTYDQYQLHDMMQRFKKEGLTVIKKFGQENLRLISDTQLRTLVRERRYWYKGVSPEREHFQNANAEVNSGKSDNKLRIVKRVDNLKIDLCVAASMGCYTALYLNL